MTTIMLRSITLFAICLVLNACTLTIPKLCMTEEADLFAKGFDHYLVSEDLTGLTLFMEEYPQGAWHDRAESVIKIVKQQRRQQASLEEKEQRLGRLKSDKEALNQDNQILELTLERLKQALIDMESHQK